MEMQVNLTFLIELAKSTVWLLEPVWLNQVVVVLNRLKTDEERRQQNI
jgi:hypothetical protein